MRTLAKPVLCLLLPTLAAHAQYVGKVGQGADKKPTLRAVAVYEYTGAMSAPSASRLVPVVVWDGTSYQPGGLYLAQPEPLAVAPGTQYVLEQSGVPSGLFNLASAGQLDGNWVGLGRYAAPAAPPPAKKLAASKKLPVLTGGSGRGKADAQETADSNRPVLHRKADSDTTTGTTKAATPDDPNAKPGDGPTLHRRDSDTSPAPSAPPSTPDDDRPVLHRSDSGSATSSTTGTPTSTGSTPSAPAGEDGPTLHRRDEGTTGGPAGSSGGGSGGGSGGAGASGGSQTSSAPDDERPTLHRGSGSDSKAPAPDADRPLLHRKADGALAADAPPDPDRPHLRYGLPAEAESRVLPTELKTSPAEAASGPGGVPIGQTIAVSDVRLDEPHPFRYSWPSPSAQADAQVAMHTLALQALATAAKATFGPAAKTDAALKQAAAAAGAPAASARPRPGHAAPAPAADPLLEPQFSAFELSYGAGATYVYTAHTAATGADRRYVLVIAQPDFYGKAHAVFTQTTRGDMLGQTPALRLIDAVDADGDHRAELLFDAQGSPFGPAAAATRQFALYSVVNGQASQVYATVAAAQ